MPGRLLHGSHPAQPLMPAGRRGAVARVGWMAMTSTSDENRESADAGPRQWVERVPGARRRARLTPVAGTDPSPEAPIVGDDAVFGAQGAAASGTPSAAGPNDERLRRDVPPHW